MTNEQSLKLLEKSETFFEDVIKEVCGQGKGYTRSGLMTLRVFSDMDDAIQEAKSSVDKK